jgi:hypothetical protein
MRNARFWHLAVIAITAGGLSLAGTGTALASGSARSEVTATIDTASSFVQVDGSTMVRYGGPAPDATAKAAATATVSGTITGIPASLSSVVVTLLARPFGAASFASLGTPLTVPAQDGTADYSFPVTPGLATGYQAEVATAAGPLLATSAARTVYVIPQVTAVTTGCATRPYCTGHLTITARFPTSSTFATETSGKHLYLYSGIATSASTTPAAPARLTRFGWAARFTTDPARDTITYSVGFNFKLGTAGYQWKINYCTPDSENLDGIGLPGHHGCGDATVSSAAPYLG